LQVDLSGLDGLAVLGEPLGVLASAVFRLHIGSPHDGRTTVSATMTSDEGNSMKRAMECVEADDPEDTRTSGQRDGERLLAVSRLVARAMAERVGRLDPYA
jgi:hypothetical protein